MQRERHKLLLIACPAPPLFFNLAFDPALCLHSCPPVVQYVFRRDVLKKLLGTQKARDFGRELIPEAIKEGYKVRTGRSGATNRLVCYDLDGLKEGYKVRGEPLV